MSSEECMQQILLAFVALFVAVDILGVLPLYLSLTSQMSREARSKLSFQSTLTATAVGLGFLIVGNLIFWVMGVTVGDFQVAGGILLLVLSIHDLLHPGKIIRRPAPGVGVVPLGTPLIVGPAVLTALVVLTQNYGHPVTLIAFGANMCLAFLVLRYAEKIGHVLGENGSEAVAKVADLFLAAFGVSLVRRGLPGFIGR
jgi:multiple antibiotic resistance protein